MMPATAKNFTTMGTYGAWGFTTKVRGGVFTGVHGGVRVERGYSWQAFALNHSTQALLLRGKSSVYLRENTSIYLRG